ncbi:MAG: TlpA family protein disulfide reductase [Prevotella sp.]|nr:TlpA family protein disulfide reductase [Prevotella sp.]
MFFNDGEKVSVDVVKDVGKGTGLNEKWGDFLAEKEKLNGNTAAFGELLKGVCYMNKDNKLPVAAILMSTQEMDFFLLTEVLNDDAPYAKHPLLAQLEEMKQAMQLRMPGTSLKDFSIPDADGKVHKMSEYIGKSKYVLVDFWASWCGPCVREMPNVVEAYKKYKSQGLEIVGVSFDQKKEAWLSAVQRLGMTWPQLSDLKGWQSKAGAVYGIRAIPANILFSPDGKVIAADLMGPALHSKLEETLK